MNKKYFKILTLKQEEEFKAYTSELCKNGFSIHQLGTIHPIIRLELIRILKQSLQEDGYT